MVKNLGPNEISLRTTGGVVAALLALFVVDIAWLRIVLALVAAILAATAFLGHCPIYRLMGKSSCPIDAADTPSPAPTGIETVPATAQADSSLEESGK